jgi:DNA-binding HxlR family transcriptional regulator
MDFNDTKWMSSQERRIMRALEQQGAKTQRELRLTLPPTDQRTPQVQAASLSRSLRRLMARGLVERYGKGYSPRTPG